VRERGADDHGTDRRRCGDLRDEGLIELMYRDGKLVKRPGRYPNKGRMVRAITSAGLDRLDKEDDYA
jgi:hypothetical protein